MAINLKNLYVGLVTDSAVAVYTPAATGVSAKINSATVYNSDSSDRTLDAWIVASGGAGAIATANQILNDKVIPAGQTISIDALLDKNVIGAGSLVLRASVTNVLVAAISGVETS